MKTNINSNQIFFVSKILQRLNHEQENIIQQWKTPSITSTRHFFLDNLLPQEDVKKIYNAFPKNADGFFDRESFREKKKTSANLSEYDDILSDITYAFQDPEIVKKISNLCGIEQIEPDPKLYAAGLSMMYKGDYLNPHIDNSHDIKRKKYRRLNILYYVSPDWLKENGGNFELWSNDLKLNHTIISHQNRLVVMETTKHSWHSVSKVVVNSPRCCISNYYFSKMSPDGNEYFHVTSFLGRPNQPIRKIIGIVDNAMRNLISKLLKVGRGKKLVNNDNEKQKEKFQNK